LKSLLIPELSTSQVYELCRVLWFLSNNPSSHLIF
jgi:hypothetical protein